MTVWGVPFSVSVRPIADPSPASRRFQAPFERMTTGAPPDTASDGTNPRPMDGATPRTSKKLAVTSTAGSLSAGPLPVSVRLLPSKAAMTVYECWRSDSST